MLNTGPAIGDSPNLAVDDALAKRVRGRKLSPSGTPILAGPSQGGAGRSPLMRTILSTASRQKRGATEALNEPLSRGIFFGKGWLEITVRGVRGQHVQNLHAGRCVV